MSAITESVPSSALSRNSADVFAAADQHPVEITRRDGENLVLMRKGRIDEQAEALAFAADLIAASLEATNTPFVDRLAARFPWMRYLSETSRHDFAQTIVESARAGAAMRNFVPFLAEIISWRETAEALALGLQPATDWYDEPRVVPHPDNMS